MDADQSGRQAGAVFSMFIKKPVLICLKEMFARPDRWPPPGSPVAWRSPWRRSSHGGMMFHMHVQVATLWGGLGQAQAQRPAG